MSSNVKQLQRTTNVSIIRQWIVTNKTQVFKLLNEQQLTTSKWEGRETILGWLKKSSICCFPSSQYSINWYVSAHAFSVTLYRVCLFPLSAENVLIPAFIPGSIALVFVYSLLSCDSWHDLLINVFYLSHVNSFVIIMIIIISFSIIIIILGHVCFRKHKRHNF